MPKFEIKFLSGDSIIKKADNMNELLVDDDGEIKEFNFYGYGLEDVESITRL